MNKKDIVKEALELLDKQLDAAIDQCVEDIYKYELENKDELQSDSNGLQNKRERH